MDIARCIDGLRRAGVEFERGLSDGELATIEARFEFTFPPDLREFLATALPVGEGWPGWRNPDVESIERRLAWPLEGLCFDIEHNAFWLHAWGPRPQRLEDAFDVARHHVDRAPRLIPVLSHRYLPDRPGLAGNPVFSVQQSDIILYGSDLGNYFSNEFPYFLQGPGQYWSLDSTPREIELWSMLVAWNNGDESCSSA